MRLFVFCSLLAASAFGQTVLRPARVFDGETTHEGWAVRVRGDRIEAAGPAASIDTAGAKVVELPGATLLPGLVEGHSHILLHAYNETPWNDQVMHEGLALRAARAVNHLRATLMAGFTTMRDLGTEGAGYADVELKQAVNQGIVPGPRVLASTRAIVATGSYAPKGFALEFRVPQGAEEADGVDSLMRVVRDQIGHGADWIKLYGDYRWGAGARRASDVLAGRDEARGGDGAERGRSRRGARQHGGGHAARDPGGRGDDRARRRRHARGFQADGRARGRAVSDAGGGRRHRAVRRLEEGAAAGAAGHSA